MVNRCSVCRHKLYEKPLIVYRNMPKAAQFFPERQALDNELGSDLFLHQCSGCGLVQLVGEPVPYFREVIRAAAYSPEMKEFRRGQFNKFVTDYSLRDKKIIEIGCGRGEYLSLMQEAGARVFGLEYAREAVEFCAKSGLTVARGFIEGEQEHLTHAPFDAFFMLNFLEHLPDPNAVLSGIRRNLTDEAVGLVEVPNFDMILEKKLFSEFICDHLFYFTKETLGLLLRMNGYEVIECRDVWYGYIISAIIKAQKQVDLTSFHEYQGKLKKEIHSYIDLHGPRNVAVWGAGHQALALLSLLEIREKLRYVVDSASFKQGKFTPATHLPVYSPEELARNPVKAVIVMAASYSDEVAEILRRKFGQKMGVAIVRDFGLEILS